MGPAEIILIAAVAQNGVIGGENDLVWDLPDDLKHFVRLTKGNPVLMGRKTFDSLYVKPLPKRTNIVISRNPDFRFDHDDVLIFKSIKAAFEIPQIADKKLYVIGGGEIYKQTINFATQLEITHIHDKYEGDTFFPEIDLSKWSEVKRKHHPKDEKHHASFDFVTYERIT